jgi:hypothetical protein
VSVTLGLLILGAVIGGTITGAIMFLGGLLTGYIKWGRDAG